ncbi:MAG: AEC family transporter [Lachnospiraceae bacterium]|nr:AEC family transporter [Lachnospiraceae bacterium]
MSFQIIIQQMGVICLLVAIGILLEKKGTVDSLTSRKISAIVVDVCNPALIMASILDGGITAGHRELAVAAVLGAVFYSVLIVTGLILPRLLKVKTDERRFYNLMCVYTNTGFLGIPVARAVLPADSILYVIVINVFYSLLFYTHGQVILGGTEKGGKKNVLRGIFSPGTIMAVLSLFVFAFDIKLPPILGNTVSYVGNATVFLSMVLLGVNISRSKLSSSLKDLRIWAFVLLRMILFPAAVVIIMNALHIDKAAIFAMCLMAAVPVGNMPMIQAEKQGMDTRVLSSAIAVTTAVSMASITLLIALCAAYLG